MNETLQEIINLSTSTTFVTPTIDEIIGLTDIPTHRVWNAYVYGSRVYGTNREDSDYDIMLIASSLDAKKEIKGEKYNIHIITPDLFMDNLCNYSMVPLECVFAPDFATIQEKTPYLLNLDKMKLKKYVLAQSFNSWSKARFKLNENDTLRGIKSVFHSLRILDFGIQILKKGRIYDFSHANHFWNEINDSNEFEWKYFNKKYIKAKKKLEWKLKIG